VRTVVLIGPPGAGKSTVGPLLAASLGVSFVDVDEVGAAYYRAAGQPLESFVDKIDSEGFPSAHRWWQPARASAAAGLVLDHPGAVIAFGAGHSHFEDRSQIESARSAVADCTVVLLLPDIDQRRSLETLRARCLDSKGHDWNRDDHDYLANWVASEQNKFIADIVVYSGDLTPERYAEKIESAIRDWDRSA
jgi:shikimate kinase